MKQTLTAFADIITEYDMLIDIDEGAFYHFYVRIVLTDGSLLYAREFINQQGVRKYGFQWQQTDTTLLIRWDNSPHHEYIPTFPHHRHVTAETNVESSTDMSLEMVLSYIHAQLLNAGV